MPRHRRVHRRARRTPAATWPFTVGWIDCLSRGPADGPRHPLLRPLGASRGGAARHCRRRAAPARRAVRAARSWSGPRGRARVQRRCYYRGTVPRVPRAASCTRRRSSIRSTRSATGTGCTAGAASPSTSACCRTRPGHGAVRRFLELLTRRGGASFLCVIKDCGAEGEGLLSFPSRGDLDRARHPGPRRHAGARRRAQRARDRGGRPRLPGQGRVHAAGALPRDGAAAAAVAGHPPAMGSGGTLAQRAVGAPARRRAVKVGVPRRDHGHGPRAGAALAARGDRLFLLGRDRTTSSAARATSRLRAGRSAVGAPRPAISSVRRRSRPRSTPPERARAARRRGRDRRRRSRRRTRSRPTPSCARRLLDGQLREHRVSASSAPARCSRAAAARSACSARWPAIAAASRSSSTARPRPACRTTSRGSTTSSAPRACASSA